MALDYRLSTEYTNVSNICLLIQNFLSKDSNFLKEEVLNKQIYKLDLFEEEGFLITVYNRKLNIQYNEFNIISNSHISFRVNKSYHDFNSGKNSMMNIIIKVINNIDSNFIFTFNSEKLLLLKARNRIIINNFSRFWESKELISTLKEVKYGYEEVSENKEIDYFPIKN